MKTNLSHRLTNRGFTLVELLVTITIIAALAGLTFSVATRSKQAAISARTISNLREIGAANGMWMAENNNFYPSCWNNNQNTSYAQLLDPYMHSTDTYRRLDSRFIGPNKRIPLQVNGYSHPMTYSMNKAVCPDVSQSSKNAPKVSLVHASRVANPTGVILMADGCQNPGNMGQSSAGDHRVDSAVGQTGTASQSSTPIPVGPDVDTAAGDGYFRYANGKCHALMCDGSAQVFLKGKILKRNIWIGTTD